MPEVDRRAGSIAVSSMTTHATLPFIAAAVQYPPVTVLTSMSTTPGSAGWVVSYVMSIRWRLHATHLPVFDDATIVYGEIDLARTIESKRWVDTVGH